MPSSQVPTRRRRKDARPGEILDAALAEFAEHGFANATLGGIARRAGIARGTIYLYFTDKDAVFDTLMRRRLTDPLEQIYDVFNGYDGTSEDLLCLLIEKLHMDAADPETVILLRVLATEGQRFPNLVQMHHDRIMKVGMGLLKRIVERGVARGEFAADRLDIDMRVLIAPALMALLWRMIFADVAPLDGKEILRGHLKLLFDGLRPPPQS